MRAIDASKLKFQMKIVTPDDNYPKKISGLKTVKQLLDEYKKPISLEAIEYFEMPFVKYGKRQAYAYVREENVVPFDEQDYLDLEEEAKQLKELKEFETQKKKRLKAQEKEDKKQQKRNNELINVAEVFSKNVIVFDTETTGFSPAKGDELLQLSITDRDSNVIYESYIKPNKKESWYSAQQVHGISPFTVRNAPSPEEVSNQVRSIFENADAIVGHNIAFDIRFIESCLGIEIPQEKVFDTMKLFRVDVPNAHSYSLESAVIEYCPNFYKDFSESAHNSTTDTRATAKVFSEIAKRGIELAKEKGVEISLPNKSKDLATSIFHSDMDDDLSYF